MPKGNYEKSSGQIDGGASSSGSGSKTPYSKTKPCDKKGLEKTTKDGVI